MEADLEVVLVPNLDCYWELSMLLSSEGRSVLGTVLKMEQAMDPR